MLYIIFSVAGTVLFINFIFTLLINLNSQKQDMFENTQIQAQMISEHCAAPLLFDDYEALKENLGILQKNPDLIHAYIYNEEGVLLAKYHSSGSLKSDFNPLKAISGKFTGNYLLIKEDITYNQTFLGHLYIYASLNSMKISLLKYFMFNMILIVLFLLFAYLLALRLQKSISEPILELASVLRTISQDKDYSLRVKKIRDDEIGILYDGFNDMLNQIHNQQMKR
ncbi:MAG: HAMP domain-containing protein, partial [Candidatus Marinimicrobia bacterium]|nr:HAMP domain-containing protein [Candidatus Neomarinimicrobiota bacterium]